MSGRTLFVFVPELSRVQVGWIRPSPRIGRVKSTLSNSECLGKIHFGVGGCGCEQDAAHFAIAYEGRFRSNLISKIGALPAPSVQECIFFNRLELALSEKQMPRFVGIVSS